MAKLNVTPDYSKFLDSFEWTHWCTFTTKYELSLKSARRLAESIYDRFPDQSQPGINQIFWAAEPFDVRAGTHIHALIHTYDSKEKLREWANKRYGRAQILDYNKQLGAHSYCAKYITKYLSDYDIRVRLRHNNIQNELSTL